MSGSAAEDVAEPSSRISPFLASEVDGNAHGSCDLLVPQAGKLAELDHLGRDRVLTRQPTELNVHQREQLVGRLTVAVLDRRQNPRRLDYRCATTYFQNTAYHDSSRSPARCVTGLQVKIGLRQPIPSLPAVISGEQGDKRSSPG